MTEYIGKNNQKDEDGNLIPAAPEQVTKRLEKLAANPGGEEARKVTGYKVLGEWQTSQAPAPHKKGETLAAGEVTIPKGMERAAHLEELVEMGLLVPQYEAAPKKPAEVEAVAAATPAVAPTTPAVVAPRP